MPAVNQIEDEISLRELWKIVWAGRVVIIGTTLVFAAVSVAYALLARQWYRADVLLSPVQQNAIPSILGDLGGLAALAGVSIGGSADTTEAVATLKSQELARAFIRDRSLTKVFFADDWDAARNRWRDSDPADWPDDRDALKYFREKVYSVSEDRKTGLVTVSVEWTDPAVAAEWANDLARRVNVKMRDRALHESSTNLAYLQDQLAKTNVVTLQQTIGKLMEHEMQKLMVARGNEEFAFRVVDRAEPPKERSWPKRAWVVILGTILGGLVGVTWVFLARALREPSPTTGGHG